MKEALIETLLERLIDWHTRRGIRQGCLCNFCLEKRSGTKYIAYTHPWARWNEFKQTLDPVTLKELDYDELATLLVKWDRERKRKIVRERLRQAKEEIL